MILSGGVQLTGLTWHLHHTTRNGTAVYVTTLSTSPARAFQTLFSGSVGNALQWPARYPNGDPRKPNDGYTTEGMAVAPPKTAPQATKLPLNVHVYSTTDGKLLAEGSMQPFNRELNFSVPPDTIPTSSRKYPYTDQFGPVGSPATYSGGALDRFTPANSFWNSAVPVGISGVDRADGWSNPADWRVHAYHPSGWGNWGFKVGAFNKTTHSLRFRSVSHCSLSWGVLSLFGHDYLSHTLAASLFYHCLSLHALTGCLSHMLTACPRDVLASCCVYRSLIGSDCH